MNQMTLNLKVGLLFSLMMFPFLLWGQRSKIHYQNRLGDTLVLVNTAEKPEKTKRPPLLTNSLSGGLALNTNGWSAIVDFAFLYAGEDYGNNNRNNFFKSRIIELSLSEIKHEKEIKGNSIGMATPFMVDAYALGKINNVYTANLGYGQHYLIAGKPDPGTVSVHWLYMGGFSTALLKPYYLDVVGLGSIKYSNPYKEEFITPGMIIGKSPFSTGLRETQFVPGMFLKTGLHFDFSPKKKTVMALEMGASASYYFKKIDQMVGQKPVPAFWNLYISLHFGGRW